MADWQPKAPANGEKITLVDGALSVPDHPIIPFIEGDGTGPDIWAAAVRVFGRGGREGVWRSAEDRLDGGFGRWEGIRADR